MANIEFIILMGRKIKVGVEVHELEGISLHGILEYTKDVYGNAPAITDCADIRISHSFRDLLHDVDRLSAGLHAAIKQKSHIVLCAENSYNWIVAFFSIICSGNIVVPLDYNLTSSEFRRALEFVDVDILVSDKEIKECSTQCIELDAFIKKYAIEKEDRYRQNINDPAIFLATSGVMSSPKYVMLSQQNIVYSTLNGLDAVPIPAFQRAYSILPFHHSYELSCGLLYHLCSGSHIYINDKKKNFIHNLRVVRPQYIVAVPSIVRSLMTMLKTEKEMLGHSPLESLKIIYCGGAAINPKIIEEFEIYRIKVLQGYGMTECAPSITFNRLYECTSNTVGKPLRYVKVKIENGEICVKAPNVMLGYYKNDEETKKVLRNGWLYTGDIGFFDGMGNLILCGRKKNLIVLNTGENVYPEEIEEKILEKCPLIRYCRVYESEGKVAASIYCPDLSEIELHEMINRINSEMSYFKRIQIIRKETEMPPVTALGKAYRKL